MRHQFYTDSRDVLKWSLVKQLATGRYVTWVVMLRPDSERSDKAHGSTRHQIEGADPTVAGFFSIERDRIAGGEPKNLFRIAKLLPSLGLGCCVVPDLYPANRTEQDWYFSRVCTGLKERPVDRRDLVFVDPDNGIAGENPQPEHVQPEHLALVWSTLRKGDGLLVYQHQFRQTNWEQMKRKQLQSVVGCSVSVHGSGAVRFLLAEK